MPARKPSGGGCSCIGGKVGDVLVVARLVSIWSPELAPGVVAPGHFPGRLGLGLTNGVFGGVNVSKWVVNVSRPKFNS